MMSTPKKKFKNDRPIARTVMYLSFTGLSLIPLWLILHQWKDLGAMIMVIGAVELAFGFYAFSAGNSAYSIVPSLPKDREDVRGYVLERARKTVSAGRLISIGAISIILTGIIAYHADQSGLPFLPAMFLEVPAYMLVLFGAIILSLNVSYICNEYLRTGDKKVFKDWKRQVEASKAHIWIIAIGCLALWLVLVLKGTAG